MVSPEIGADELEATMSSAPISPRISFSTDFLDDDSFISISPTSSLDDDAVEREIVAAALSTKTTITTVNSEFEFLSSKNSFDGVHTMLTADELFFEGKLLPSWQTHHATTKLSKINLSDHVPGNNGKDHVPDHVPSGNGNHHGIVLPRDEQEPRIWFVDDDPSPRPPKCTVLWKELLRLKKQRPASTLSPSSSSSSSSSSTSLGDVAVIDEKSDQDQSQSQSRREKHIKRIKKGLERARSASIRIRPMVNVPICNTQGKPISLPPLFPLRKPKLDA